MKDCVCSQSLRLMLDKESNGDRPSSVGSSLGSSSTFNIYTLFIRLIQHHPVTGHRVSLYFCCSLIMTQQPILLYLLNSSLLAGHVSQSQLRIILATYSLHLQTTCMHSHAHTPRHNLWVTHIHRQFAVSPEHHTYYPLFFILVPVSPTKVVTSLLRVNTKNTTIIRFKIT